MPFNCFSPATSPLSLIDNMSKMTVASTKFGANISKTYDDTDKAHRSVVPLENFQVETLNRPQKIFDLFFFPLSRQWIFVERVLGSFRTK